MELDHEFTVATDPDTAWPVLLDVERMHPLMPGVTYESGADGEYRGKLKIKFGPTTITYRGTVRLAVLDDLTRTAILEVSARESRGQGTVTGSFQAVVLPADAATRVALHTRLDFTGGRAASLGEHLVHDTGAKLLARFATNLNLLLTTPNTPTPSTPPPTATTENATPAEPATTPTEPAPPTTATPAEPSAASTEPAPPTTATPAESPAPTEPATPAATTPAEPATAPTELAPPATATPAETPAPTEPATPAATTPAEPAAAPTEPTPPATATPAETPAPTEPASPAATTPAENSATPAERASSEPEVPAEPPVGAGEPVGGRAAVVLASAAVRVEERGSGDELELYEMTEPAGRIRRVLPLVGVLVLLVIVARRLVRRR